MYCQGLSLFPKPLFLRKGAEKVGNYGIWQKTTHENGF